MNSSPRTRRKILLITLGLVALAAWAAWVCWPESVQRRPLPDGSELTLHSVTFGQRHRMSAGQRWQDRVGSLFPERLARHLGSQFVVAGETNELRFWLVRAGLTTRPSSQFRAVTVDSHGCELGLTSISETAFSSGGRALWTMGFSVFPRREPHVTLRIHEQKTNNTWAVCAEFTVPNPGRAAHPLWDPEPLPQTNRVGGVDVVLLEAVGSVQDGIGPPIPWTPGERPGVYLRFAFFENGRRSSAWAVAGQKWSDATGQTAGGLGGISGFTAAGDYKLITGGGLCWQETAWNLPVDLVRTAKFPKEDLWIIPRVPLPTSPQSASIVNATTNLHGAQLRLTGIVGPDCPSPKARRMLSGRHLIHLDRRQLNPDQELQLVRVVDQRERELRSLGQASEAPDYFFAVTVPPDVTSLDVTFAVTRKVRLEFRAQPTRVDAAGVKRLAR